eukprot:3197154-Prymnesium_polylepis.2
MRATTSLNVNQPGVCANRNRPAGTNEINERVCKPGAGGGAGAGRARAAAVEIDGSHTHN